MSFVISGKKAAKCVALPWDQHASMGTTWVENSIAATCYLESGKACAGLLAFNDHGKGMHQAVTCILKRPVT